MGHETLQDLPRTRERRGRIVAETYVVVVESADDTNGTYGVDAKAER